jgi:hypothetical protein
VTAIVVPTGTVRPSGTTSFSRAFWNVAGTAAAPFTETRTSVTAS